MPRLVGVLVVQETACVPVAAVAYVAREWPFLLLQGHVCPCVDPARRSVARVVCQLVNRQEGLLTSPAFNGSGSLSPHTAAAWPALSEVSTGMGQQLLFPPEAFSTILARVPAQ